MWGLLNIVVYLAALVGCIHITAALTGNETVQPFRSLYAIRPDLMKDRYVVLTRNIRNEDSVEAHWQALQPSLNLLNAISPDIAKWIVRLYNQNQIIWEKKPHFFNWPVLAAYGKEFYFAPDFWKLSEGDKAAVIAHEYFHYRQNKSWMVGDVIMETLTGKLSEYGSRTEDEAYLYQIYAYRAMAMPPGEIATSYFRKRNLYQFLLSPSGDARQ